MHFIIYLGIHLTHLISPVASGTPHVPLEILEFTGAVVDFLLKQKTFIFLCALWGLESNLYRASVLLPTTAPTNQFIVSAFPNGCWNSHKQQCKINEGKCIEISISITDSVRSVS